MQNFLTTFKIKYTLSIQKLKAIILLLYYTLNKHYYPVLHKFYKTMVKIHKKLGFSHIKFSKSREYYWYRLKNKALYFYHSYNRELNYRTQLFSIKKIKLQWKFQSLITKTHSKIFSYYYASLWVLKLKKMRYLTKLFRVSLPSRVRAVNTNADLICIEPDMDTGFDKISKNTILITSYFVIILAFIGNYMGNYFPNFNFATAASPPLETEEEPTLPIYVMVRPKDYTTLSSETTATIKSITKREGESFLAQDILIEFDCRVQHADLKKALAQKKLTESAYTSAKKLTSYGAISDAELIKAQSEAEMSVADVDKLTAMVDKCIIKAPYNGSVSESMSHVGEAVKPGDPLLKIVNVENLELNMQIPSSWLKWLQVGSEFKVNINELNKTLDAKIQKINPEINSVSQTVKIIGVLIKPEPLLLPGMSGQAIFQQNSSSIRPMEEIKKLKTNHTSPKE